MQNPRNPAVAYLAQVLEERIEQGNYQSGTWLPTERALSEEFAVDRSVVRAAFLQLEARQLIVRAQGRRPWVRERAQPVPATSEQSSARIETRRRNIGLWIWPNPTHPATNAVAQGICTVLDQSQYRLIIGNIFWSSWDAVRRAEAEFLGHMATDDDVVGVLLWYLGGKDNLPALHKLRAANVPVLFMDRLPPEGYDADFVGVDNEFAAEAIVGHLIAQGHREIAHITNGENASTVQERLAGYRRALEKAGLTYRPRLVLTNRETGEGDEEATSDLLAEELLSLPNPPTAAFAVNDVTAEILMVGLRRRGIRIPEDVAVAGFDGIERWTTSTPFLTTVQQPFELIGSNAIKLLLQRIETGPTTACRHLLLQAPLCIYDSTRRD